MEDEITKKLKTLIEALTHSGSNTLDENIFKQVKKICKSSQDKIPYVYNLILIQLKKSNSQIRLAAFQICKELFKRSGLFRESFLKDLDLIFKLTTGINSSKKLPPPKLFSERLKSLAILTLKEWVEEFGSTYKKLKIAYNYFQKCKQVDFTTFQVANSAEQAVENEQQRHLRLINEEKIRKILEEYNNNESEIQMTITSLLNCLSLLLPPAEEFFISECNLQGNSTSQNDKNVNSTSTSIFNEKCHSDNDSNLKKNDGNEDEESYFNDKNNLRECGIPLNYNLTVELNIGEKYKVSKTEENSSVIENAEDCVRLIVNRFLPMVKNWIKIYCKCSEGNSNEIKKIIDLKEQLENILRKYNSIFINDLSHTLINENSSDDEFEEVKKEGYEEAVDFSEALFLDSLKSTNTNSNSEPQTLKSLPKEAISDDSINESEPTIETISNIGAGEPGPSGLSKSTLQDMDRKKKLLSIAPKLPYDIDLYHWEDEHLSTPTLLSTKIDVDKFWGSAGSDDIHEIPNPYGIAALRTRVIEYSGNFEPVKWACRAPLPNGKLCPRRDRFKCPFHGKIVARDEMGNIQNKEDQKHFDQVAKVSAATVHESQDPEFLKDLQAATGLDLRLSKQKNKKRTSEKNFTHKKMNTSRAALKIVEAQKLPGLIDVVKRQNNAYTRLSKKIFNKSSLKRVSSVLNRLDRNKFLDKYSDQFNYI